MTYPMGEAKLGPLRVNFDCRLKLEFHGGKITSDAGLLAYRELDHALGLTVMAGSILTETRRGKNIRHLVEGMFRQSVFGRLAGLLPHLDRRGKYSQVLTLIETELGLGMRLDRLGRDAPRPSKICLLY